jgi:hypothetical protein
LWAKDVIVNWWREQKARRSKVAKRTMRPQAGKNRIPMSKIERSTKQTQAKQLKQRKVIFEDTFQAAAEEAGETSGKNDDLWLTL